MVVGIALALAAVAILLDNHPVTALNDLQSLKNPAASAHLPPFITPPGATDVLLVVMAFILVGSVLAAGVFFFWLHSLPERMVHNSTKVHFDVVAALGLLALFTHVHLFWVAALLLALVKIPEFSIPNFSSLLGRMAASLERIAGAKPKKADLPPRDTTEHVSQR
jgi:hypothetical protein